MRVRRVPALLAAACLLAALATPIAAQEPERLCDEVLVEMSDGVRLHSWVSRLAPDQPRPVMIEMESYARPGNGCPSYVPGDFYPHLLSQEQFDRFTILHVSYRGAGSSEGLFDVTGPETQRDVREVIAWARTQPWSTGDIVLTGGSGTAFAAHHGLREPGVRLAIIYSSCADMYRCFRRGGSYNSLADVYLDVTMAGYADGLDDRSRLGTGANPPPLLQLAAFSQAQADTKSRSVLDAWWAERSALAAIAEGVDVPVVLTTDPYDIVQPWEALQLIPGARLNLGVGHTSPSAIEAGGPRFDELVGGSIDALLDAVVFGEGEVPEDLVTLVTTLGSVATWRAGQALVRSEPSWPLPATDWTRLHLAPGPTGSAGSLNDGALALDAPPADAAGDTAPLLSAPSVRGDFRTVDWLGGANTTTDLRDEEARGLTYTTPVLEQAVEVTGPLTLRLWATAVAPDFDWAVRVTNVHPDGASEWVTDGYLRASLRAVDEERSLRNAEGEIVRPWHPFDNPEPPPAGEPVEYLIDVIPTSAVFQAGHRLRVDVLPVASGPVEQPGGAGTVTILRDAEHPSQLLLPVIPRDCDRSTPLLEDMAPVGPCAPSYADAIGALPTRVAGPGRVDTAVEVSRTAFPDGADTVLLARADDYADALAGAPLAAQQRGPILLTAPDVLSDEAAAELVRLAPARVVLLGGEGALGPAVESNVRTRLPQAAVDRVAGPNRFATAALVAETLDPGSGLVFVVEGEHDDPARGWPDALAAAPYAAQTGRPILLVNADRLPAETAVALNGLADELVVVGGEAAVSPAVVEQMAAATGAATRRLAGTTRYETSRAVHDDAVAAGADPTRLWLASGAAFPDALAAGPAVGALGETFMLVDGHDLDGSPPTRAVLEAGAGGFQQIRLLGGRTAISDRVLDQVRTIAGPPAQSVS